MPLQLFVDTNIFLSFYHYTKDELDEIRKLTMLIRNTEIKLFITQQVVDEFRRNREVKLNDALKQINDKFRFGDYPSFCKEFPVFSELEESIKKAQSIHKQLIDYTTDKISSNTLRADQVITELFRSAEILKISETIYEKAKKRVCLGNPPGKNGSYGDAINWEIILENSGMFDDLHIVANDKDYYSLLDPKVINPFLKAEYAENMVGDVSCYRSLTSFFKNKFPAITLEAEEEKEDIVNNFVGSPNFRSTRKALSQLKKYDTYSKQQIEMILAACFNNTQINWILTDEDIKQGIYEFFNKHSEKLDDEFKANFLYQWSKQFPNSQEPDNIELPF